MIRIGVAGVGHLGKIHLKILRNLPEFELVGFYDENPETAQAVAEEYNLRAYTSLQELLEAVDALDVVCDTRAHYAVASAAIRRSKHVFIEKPVTATLEEAEKLTDLVREAGVKAMVGHVERFNPAFLALKERKLNPMFIEIHRLAQWNPRGADVSVIHDLMIHDLDLVLYLVKAGIKKISASGVHVITDTPDIANARIEFYNGAVANLTASRISMKQMRRMRLFQKNAYITVDFLERKTEVYSILEEAQAQETLAQQNGSAETPPPIAFEAEGRTRYLQAELPPVAETNALELELKRFAECLEQRLEPEVGVYEATQALQAAQQVAEKVRVMHQ